MSPTRAAAKKADGADPARSRASDAALVQAWEALIGGAWSILDSFDSDGRRYLIARVNGAAIPGATTSSRAQRVARLVALGHSNKAAGYELGISSSTVGVHLRSVLRALGIRSRMDLVRMLGRLATATPNARGGRMKPHPTLEARDHDVRITAFRHADEERLVLSYPIAPLARALTRAELAVARLAAAGLSNGAIARRRGRALRTVANQIAVILAKLGLQSRYELGRLLSTEPVPAPAARSE